MDREDALRRLERLCAKSGHTPAEREEIESLSWGILHKGVRRCDCPDRWRDAAVECLHYLRSTIRKGKVMTTYFLKKGTVIFWQDKVYTNANLTDDVARAFLEKYPKAAARFEVIPQDVKPAEAAADGGNSDTTPEETPKEEKTPRKASRKA